MNREEMIEAAARAMAAYTYIQPDAWDMWVKDETTRTHYRRKARAALEAADALPPEPEQLPVGTRKRSHNGVEAVLAYELDDEPWVVYCGARVSRLSNKHVANWEIISNQKGITS